MFHAEKQLKNLKEDKENYINQSNQSIQDKTDSKKYLTFQPQGYNLTNHISSISNTTFDGKSSKNQQENITRENLQNYPIRHTILGSLNRYSESNVNFQQDRYNIKDGMDEKMSAQDKIIQKHTAKNEQIQNGSDYLSKGDNYSRRNTYHDLKSDNSSVVSKKSQELKLHRIDFRTTSSYQQSEDNLDSESIEGTIYQQKQNVQPKRSHRV